jgi:O-antigen ligase
VLASLSPFALHVAGKRFGAVGWMIAAALLGLVILLAGARASWITFALVLLFSGWELLGVKRLAGVFAFGALSLGLLTATVPQVRERIVRTTYALAADQEGVDVALSGRTRIWGAAACMVREHPVNGVGARGFRYAFPAAIRSPALPPSGARGRHCMRTRSCWRSSPKPAPSVCCCGWPARRWPGAHGGSRRRWQRDHARPAMLALAATVFPFNTHLAFYSTFWGGVALLLAALYAGRYWAGSPCDGWRYRA